MEPHSRLLPIDTPLENVRCPNGCAGPEEEVLHAFSPFRVCRCSTCSLVYLNPRLQEESLSDFYGSETYFSGEHDSGYDTYEKDKILYHRTFARRFRLIHRYKQSGKHLDIGCSLGYCLDVSKTFGFEPWGLDCSTFAVQRCSERFPGQVKLGFLEPGIFPDHFVDIVTMFDLFEHVYHPDAFLKLVHSILKPDGIVVITTPNHSSLLSRVSGKSWVSYKIPEHVYYYTPKTLRTVVSPYFDIVSTRSEGQYCTLAFLAERLKTINRLIGSTMLGAIRRLHAEKYPIYVNSGSMTAILRKKS